jgi:hypothetical protein
LWVGEQGKPIKQIGRPKRQTTTSQAFANGYYERIIVATEIVSPQDLSGRWKQRFVEEDEGQE